MVANQESTPPGKADNPIPRFGDFLASRFGAARSFETLLGDFNGNGKLDVAAVIFASNIGDALLVFHDPSGPDWPTTWVSLDVLPQGTVGVERHRDHDVLVLGTGDQRIVAELDRATGEYRWSQWIPAALEGALGDATSRLARTIVWRGSLGASAFDAVKDELVHAFVGDFDGDGAVELAVVSTPDDQLLHYRTGTTPSVTALDYPAATAMLHAITRVTVRPFPSDPSARPFTQRNDFIELAIPESSSIYLTFEDGAWKRTWISD